MSTLATVGIHDYLASGQARISVRSTDDELAGGVHIILDVIVEECQHLGLLYALEGAWYQYLTHVLGYLLLHGLVGVELIVLCGEHDGVYALWLSLVGVLHCHLALGVGTQVSHHLAFAPYLCQHHQQTVCQVESQRHVVVGLVGCVAEHHTLVAGTLFLGSLPAYASVDVGTLLMYGAQHATAVAVKHVFGLGIADAVDHLACYALQVNVCLTRHLARQEHLSGGYHRLAGHMGLRVEGQQLVKHSVTNLVGHLVGMSF